MEGLWNAALLNPWNVSAPERFSPYARGAPGLPRRTSPEIPQAPERPVGLMKRTQP